MAKQKSPRLKFNKERRDAFLSYIAQGVRRTAACNKVGISRVTYWRYLNNNPEFEKQLLQAEIDANELVEQALFATALKGNVTAQQVWLYNRDPERWKDKRNITLGGDSNNPLKFSWVDLMTEDDDETADEGREAVSPEKGPEGSGLVDQ